MSAATYDDGELVFGQTTLRSIHLHSRRSGERLMKTIAVETDDRVFFFFQAEDGIRDYKVTGVQTCALPILYLLPEIFAEFQRKYPQVHISIYRNFSHKILQRVEDGSVDVGIVSLPLKSPNLKVHHIYRDRLRLMVSVKNPLANRNKVSLEEVAGQPLIVPRTGFTRQVLDKLFRPFRSRVHVAMELPSIGMIKKFVGADAGVSFISESFAKDQVKAGEVKLLSVEGVDLWRELGLVYRRDRSLPRAAQALIALIREHRKGSEGAEAN